MQAAQSGSPLHHSQAASSLPSWRGQRAEECEERDDRECRGPSRGYEDGNLKNRFSSPFILADPHVRRVVGEVLGIWHAVSKICREPI